MATEINVIIMHNIKDSGTIYLNIQFNIVITVNIGIGQYLFFGSASCMTSVLLICLIPFYKSF